MSKRRDPASEVVTFFEHADLAVAQTVLAICKGIVAKRQPAKVTKPRVVKPTVEREAVS
jgi:hypothetical protein